MKLDMLLVLGVLGAILVQTSAQTDKVFCYYGSWAVYRNGAGKVDVEDIDPTLCTHLIFTFVGLSTSGGVVLLDSWNEVDLNALARFVNLKKRNPTLKVLVAMGGWNEGSLKYSNVAASPNLRATMVSNVVTFVKKYGFDGFDLDWEYPGMRGGAGVDRANFVLLLKDLRTRFDQEGLILTIAVGSSQEHISNAYNIAGISQYVHYILLMSYDLHGSWDWVTGQNAPLYASSKESSAFAQLTLDAIIKNWMNQGAPASKLVLGIPLYGHTYTLANANNNQLGAATSGPGNAGTYTQEAGSLTYLEICESLNKGGWTTVWDDEQKVPYAFAGNQWVGYDNPRSVQIKAEYAKSKGLVGVMVWSVEQDDGRNICGGGKYPLMNAIKAGLGTSGTTTTTLKPSGTTTTTTTTKGTGTTTTTSPTTGNYCTSTNMARDPSNCNIFYICELLSSGVYKSTRMSCGTGLYFNVVNQYCDWPENVKC